MTDIESYVNAAIYNIKAIENTADVPLDAKHEAMHKISQPLSHALNRLVKASIKERKSNPHQPHVL